MLGHCQLIDQIALIFLKLLQPHNVVVVDDLELSIDEEVFRPQVTSATVGTVAVK